VLASSRARALPSNWAYSELLLCSCCSAAQISFASSSHGLTTCKRLRVARCVCAPCATVCVTACCSLSTHQSRKRKARGSHFGAPATCIEAAAHAQQFAATPAWLNHHTGTSRSVILRSQRPQHLGQRKHARSAKCEVCGGHWCTLQTIRHQRRFTSTSGQYKYDADNVGHCCVLRSVCRRVLLVSR